MQKGKALQVMVGVGPFTTKDSLSYDALNDMMQIVNRDKPHTLILCGPFIDGANTDIQNGEVCFRNADGKL